MVDLEDLPVEVLTAIFSPLVGTYTHYPLRGMWFGCELAGLSRFFADVMRPIIYKSKIIIYFLNSGAASRCLLLLRSMEENPEISRLIVDLELSWDNPVNEEVEMADHLLANLPNLRTLVFQQTHMKQAFEPRFFEINPMINLRKVSLIGDKLLIGTVNKYMNLPRLEQMSINSPLIGTLKQVDDLQHNSAVRTLVLEGVYQVTPKAMHSLLKLHPGITALRAQYFGTYHEAKMRSSLLSPLQNSLALISLKDSLENLQIGGDWAHRHHDGTRMDLSTMTSLRFLNCHSMCYFPPDTITGKTLLRVGLYKLLPPNIEEVTIRLDRNNPTLFDESNSSANDRTSAESGIPPRLLWLAELAINKKKFMPALKMLRLNAAPRQPRHRGKRRPDHNSKPPVLIRWSDTGVVGKELAVAGIVVEAWHEQIPDST